MEILFSFATIAILLIAVKVYLKLTGQRFLFFKEVERDDQVHDLAVYSDSYIHGAPKLRQKLREKYADNEAVMRRFDTVDYLHTEMPKSRRGQ